MVWASSLFFGFCCWQSQIISNIFALGLATMGLAFVSIFGLGFGSPPPGEKWLALCLAERAVGKKINLNWLYTFVWCCLWVEMYPAISNLFFMMLAIY
jgi:hypothetical protein